MQLEAGKFYKTRGGDRAWVAAVGNPLNAKAAYPVIGFIGVLHMVWRLDGAFARLGEDSRDLVAEWVEPAVDTFDVVLVRHADGEITKYLGKVGYVPLCCKVIARRTITLTEGEGV